MKTEILIDLLQSLITKVKTENMEKEEYLVLSSLLSMYNKGFPIEERDSLKYIFTGWYVHQCLQEQTEDNQEAASILDISSNTFNPSS